MNRARLAVAVLAVAGVAAVWMLVRSGGEAPRLEEHRGDRASGLESPPDPGVPDASPQGRAATRIAPRAASPLDEPEALETGPGIRVQVVDESGRPVGGVRALLAREANGVVSSAGTSEPTDAATGQTTAWMVGERGGSVAEGARWFVTVDTPFIDPPEADFDPANLPEGPIRVSIGPTGRVLVLVQDAQGEPLSERTLVTLTDITKEGSKPRLTLPPACARTTTSGSVLFERVGIGTRLRAYARGDGRRYPARSLAPGPGIAGGEVTIAIKAEAGGSMITGRVLDAEGRPLPRRELQAVVFTAGDLRTRFAITTDSAARFRTEILEVHERGEERRIELRIERGIDDVVVSGSVDLSRPLPAADTDVGDVVLRPPPLIAAGTVVDEGGLPVAGASFRLEILPRGAVSGRSVPRTDWMWSNKRTLPSDADGRFEIRCREEGPLRVQAEKAGYWSENPVEIVKGQDDVVLRVNRGGRIEGSLVHDGGFSHEDLTVTAILEDVNPTEWKVDGTGFTQRPGDAGQFVFARLRSGSFRVTVELKLENLVFADVKGVEVVAGEVTRDPRLQKIDLSGMGKIVTLSVVDSEGRLLGNAEAAEMGDAPPGSRGRSTAVRAHDGKVRMRLRGRSPDVTVGAPGYRRTVVSGVDSDRTVTLERGFPVRLSFSGPGLGPRDDVRVDWELRAVDPETDPPGGPGGDAVARVAVGSFQLGSTGSLHVSEPGRWRVELTLRKDQLTTRVATAWITVANTGSEQTFEITAAPADVEKALRQIEWK